MTSRANHTILFLLVFLVAYQLGLGVSISSTAISLSDTKFVSRIERKQEMLIDMKQCPKDLLAACNEAIQRKKEKALLRGEEIASGKDFSTLEGKLSIVVKDSVKDTMLAKGVMNRPVNLGNCIPESYFKKEKKK